MRATSPSPRAGATPRGLARTRTRLLARFAAVVALIVSAGTTGALVLAFDTSAGSSAELTGGVGVPADARYRATVESLLTRHDARVRSLTLGPGGTVQLTPAAGRAGFPAAYLNPLGVVTVAHALMGVDETISVRRMRLAQSTDGRLVWRLEGRRDDVGTWTAEIRPNGTGLRTVKP